MTASQELSLLLDDKSKIIGTTYGGTSYMAIQNIIRCVDTILPFYRKLDNVDNPEANYFRKFVEFGWPRLLKVYYDDIDINEHLPFTILTDDLIEWTISNLIYAGKIESCRHLISYEKADLAKFEKKNSQHYTFTFLNKNNGIENFDKASLDFYRDKIVKKIIEDRRKAKPFDVKKIKEDFQKLITNPFGKLISYTTTPDIDDYYNEEGHYQLLMMQGYDDFDNNDVFGEIEYHKYITIVELIIGIGIKHTDACFMLKKINNDVKLGNLLTYTQSKYKAINDYAEYLGWKPNEVQQIFEAITLTKDNFDYYLEFPSTPPPIFIEVGGELLIRSIAGCFSNPFLILNRELKRKFKKDYDKAVNNRENRFRNELFMFFPSERIIKIRKEINLSFNGIKTDIDAVVFDKQTGTLGLFQLKWQDPYAESLKERYSRISNLFPKANEWIDKIRKWIATHTSKTILNSLQIDKELDIKAEINDIYLFVISRNQMNFTGVQLDEHVAWSSWHQLIESMASVKSMFDDPIREMFIKIKILQPESRILREEGQDFDELEIGFEDFKVSYLQ
ncbi:hypothetical protein EH151_06610 [Elizabethkingia anophelis]|uniref:hypothetical protein n=1 Tax=Elizabethkingia anophelis TaxID=1117645 RepID=UPI001367AAFA|nr:hypothetical protein [Elizabethkingia anophelis]MCT4049123.1 hypothetical protein [Elizabethkingia anophelis]MYZ59560.1 hypothetical protein [Elizabethkingia anophelis]